MESPVALGLLVPVVPPAAHDAHSPSAVYLARAAGGGRIVAAFSIRDVRPRRREVVAAVCGPQGRHVGSLPLPPVVDNRAVHYRRGDVKRLSSLAELPGITLLNQANRYDPGLVFDVCATDPECRPYLPPRLAGPDVARRLAAGDAALVLGPGGGRGWLGFRRGNGLVAAGPAEPGRPGRAVLPLAAVAGGRAKAGRAVILAVGECIHSGGHVWELHCAAQRDAGGIWHVLAARWRHRAAEDPVGRAPATRLPPGNPPPAEPPVSMAVLDAAVRAAGRPLARFLPSLYAAEFRFWLGRNGSLRLVRVGGLAFNAPGSRDWPPGVWERSADLSLALMEGLAAAGRMAP